MKLSEDRVVVQALKHILEHEKYYFLEYDEEGSKNKDYLSVKVIDRKAKRDHSITNSIRKELERKTQRFFYPITSATNDSQDWNTVWTYFNIREKKS